MFLITYRKKCRVGSRNFFFLTFATKWNLGDRKERRIDIYNTSVNLAASFGNYLFRWDPVYLHISFNCNSLKKSASIQSMACYLMPIWPLPQFAWTKRTRQIVKLRRRRRCLAGQWTLAIISMSIRPWMWSHRTLAHRWPLHSFHCERVKVKIACRDFVALERNNWWYWHNLDGHGLVKQGLWSTHIKELLSHFVY